MINLADEMMFLTGFARFPCCEGGRQVGADSQIQYRLSRQALFMIYFKLFTSVMVTTRNKSTVFVKFRSFIKMLQL